MPPSTQATLVYDITLSKSATGKATAIIAQVESVPLPLDFLFDIGVGLVSDNTASAVDGSGVTHVTRTVVLSLVPAVLPTFNVARNLSADTGPISLLTINNAGQDLVAPPLVVFGDTFVIPAGTLKGQHYVPPRTAIAKTSLDVRAVPAIINGGTGYTGGTQVVAFGGLMPGGVAATFTTTVMAGVITNIAIRTPGGPYVKPPTLVAVDPGPNPGSGAVFGVPDMKLHDVTLVDPGLGYVQPTAVALPLFKKTWPDSLGVTKQEQPFFDLLTVAIAEATSSPVVASAPVVA